MPTASRVLILGLDSAPPDWFKRWAGEGWLPNLKALMDRGAFGVLRSVRPPLSPAAWCSFATGVHPGKHGVFDHIYRRAGAYDLAPTSATTRTAKAVWEIISEHQGRVGIINVPETYPPSRVNGFMLSGMDTPSDEADFAYPPELKAELEAAIGGYKVFGPRSKENLDRSIAGMFQTIPMRARAGRYLWDKYRPDLMVLVFMETDVIQHKCWKYMDPAHPQFEEPSARKLRTTYTTAIPRIYARIDEALGPWLDSLDADTTVLVMSDHGAGPLHKFLHINNWLVREGFLKFRRTAVTRLKRAAFDLGLTPSLAFDLAQKLHLGLADLTTRTIKRRMTRAAGSTALQRAFLAWPDVDWSQTRAYSLGGNMTGIYVNLRGREPLGEVSPGAEYEAVREELESRLLEWEDPATGDKIVRQVFRREQIYDGPMTVRAPDVIFETLEDGYVGFGGHEFADNRLMADSPLFNGHHRMDGMILLAGPGVRPGRMDTRQIVDLAPTVLHLLGYPVPGGMDGSMMAQAFTPEFLIAHPPRAEKRESLASGDLDRASGYTQAEKAEVLSRLKDLGYV